mmetsp:Transcript_13446/g.31557  ORF Transcript_13446/g.31557 Transcript_13446/m.31557 type:complete len:449 (-) Transcript_13446:82-1428(-)|eukprot:CAMPEP_0171124012 /NCGR_PEP_ID=MMETSP0766_2-20121228/108327_1 /TAXON_ID=439317 /ORGANISM="Gambierdiscus australes, Strain CAWD 149" /LENGTH=448 /DNA_ID=CAMNT_0011586907 /DNA_START=72 /DNA_END=1418 /DNA_ORIENTATION=+
MSAILIATIRRLPGGKFAKVPRSQGAPALPVHTTIRNLTTYFRPWPKHKSQFLLYGPRRFIHTAGAGLENQQEVHIGAPGLCNGQAGKEFHLYGGAARNGASEGAPAAPATAVDADDASAAGGGTDSRGTSAPAVTATTQRLGLAGLSKRFHKGDKLTMITAYDFPSARFARGAGVELVLVGDSLGNCRLGLASTVGVTMDDMLRATASARRGIDAPPHPHSIEMLGPKPILVGDMPFGSYLVEAEALRNAAALRMAGADVVKLEGGRQMAPFVRALTRAGIAVMGHVGLEPQKAFLQGGFRLQGVTAQAALAIVQDAKDIAEAGAVALVLECVPAEVGQAVQAALPHTPVIGIGAGGHVAGQVLVCDDLLGMHGTPPTFVKLYANLGKTSIASVASFRSEVRNGAFPGDQHARRMQPSELRALQQLLPELVLADTSSTLVAAECTTS